MFDAEVLPIVGVIAVAMFGFLNGWLARRLCVPADDVSVGNVPALPPSAAVPPARWANGPRAVLLGTRPSEDLETGHAPGVSAVVAFGRDGDTRADAGQAGDAAGERIAALTRRLAERDEEVAGLRLRVELLDPLLSRLRDRDEWLADLRMRHADALIEKNGELARCEARIADLETMFADLEDLATSFDEVTVLRRRVAQREDEKAASRRARVGAGR